MGRRDRKNDWEGMGRGLSLLFQIGLAVLVPVFLCLAAGIWLRERLDFGWAPVVLLFLGILAGGRNAYVLAREYLKAEEARDKRRREKSGDGLNGKDSFPGDRKKSLEKDGRHG